MVNTPAGPSPRTASKPRWEAPVAEGVTFGLVDTHG